MSLPIRMAREPFKGGFFRGETPLDKPTLSDGQLRIQNPSAPIDIRLMRKQYCALLIEHLRFRHHLCLP
jgi:hypothetical protein